MLFTSNNDQYTIHMHSTSTSTVHCTYGTECISILFGLVQFYLGGLHTVQYRVFNYFLLGSILFGGLKPPQALMTRRPWASLLFVIDFNSLVFVIYQGAIVSYSYVEITITNGVIVIFFWPCPQCWEGTRVLVLEYCTRVLYMSTRNEYLFC